MVTSSLKDIPSDAEVSDVEDAEVEVVSFLFTTLFISSLFSIGFTRMN